MTKIKKKINNRKRMRIQIEPKVAQSLWRQARLPRESQLKKDNHLRKWIPNL